MPRIPKEKLAPSDLYGMTRVETNISFRDRMKKRFRPTDTVKVRNITNKKVEWQWFDELDETYTIEDETNIKIVDREDPGLWELGPGETDVLIGACAYMFIDALYKQVCILKTGIVINPLSEREIRNFSIDDPEKQEQFIDAVFEGKLSPNDMQLAAIAEMGRDTAPRVSENLPDLITEREELNKRTDAQRSMLENPSADRKDIKDLAGEFAEGSPLLGTATGGLPEDRKDPEPAPQPKAEEAKPKTTAAAPKKDKTPVAA